MKTKYMIYAGEISGGIAKLHQFLKKKDSSIEISMPVFFRGNHPFVIKAFNERDFEVVIENEEPFWVFLEYDESGVILPGTEDIVDMIDQRIQQT